MNKRVAIHKSICTATATATANALKSAAVKPILDIHYVCLHILYTSDYDTICTSGKIKFG